MKQMKRTWSDGIQAKMTRIPKAYCENPKEENLIDLGMRKYMFEFTKNGKDRWVNFQWMYKIYAKERTHIMLEFESNKIKYLKQLKEHFRRGSFKD